MNVRSMRFVGAIVVALLAVPRGAAVAQEALYPGTFPLGDVALLEGPFQRARDLNITVLLQYDVDRLLAPYRKEAGLAPRASSYPNWDGLDGHVGGHYLSAMAMNAAATGSAECRRRMEYMIAELKDCQEANARNHPSWGVGYLGGVPKSKAVWSGVQAGNLAVYRAAWVPWYNVHKMYAGLRDAWNYAGNQAAKAMFLRFCDWGIAITGGLSDSLMQSMLDTEHGGMAEVFADAYQMTGDAKYLLAARRFSHRVLLEAMAAGKDNLDNKHANTQIPKIIGFTRIGELTHGNHYGAAGRFFWETVTGHRSLAFGGNSRKEHFPSVAACDDFVNDPEGPETCNSYNMLKLTEDLFRVAPAAAYVDYYERTLYNHILSSQHPGHGGYVYFTPARPRHYRVYSSPNQAMWCCVGTGMENHGKYGEFIYAHRHDSLYVNLFIASVLNWREKGVEVRQETTFPDEECTRLTITKGRARFRLLIRHPSWVAQGTMGVAVNGVPAPSTSRPSSYVMIDREWNAGDVVEVHLPMRNRVEYLPHRTNYLALLHGPILLAAKTGTEDLAGLIADDGRWSQTGTGRRLPLDRAPILVRDNPATIADGMVPMEGKPLTFGFSGVDMINPVNVVLEPFFRIHDARYMMYWMALSKSGYQSYLDSLASVEQGRLALDQRTIDGLAPGEQQPEVDHGMENAQSNAGNTNDAFWREASNGGFFSYRLATRGEKNLLLRVRYWGYEWGGRKFAIYVDDAKLVSEDNTGRWYKASFQDLEYAIPDTLVAGKEKIRVRFQSLPNNTAGGVYDVRLVRATAGKKESEQR